MGRIDSPDNLASVRSWEELREYVARFFRRADLELNGRLDFVDNIRAAGPFTVTLMPAQDTVIRHGLSVVPLGVLPIEQAIAASVLTQSKTTESITLRGSATFAVTLFVI